MKISKCFAAPILVAVFLVSSVTNAALVSRLGGLAYYDDVANLTWLQDANYAQTSGFDANGLLTWADANAWVASLDIAGVSGWRLPNTIDVGNDGPTYTNIFEGVDYGYNITTHSEMSNMFYNVLGNIAVYDTSGNVQTGFGLSNTGPFSNMGSVYWSATEFVFDGFDAWYFAMNDGGQNESAKTNSRFAWAVHDGDVAAVVPLPGAVWLFGSGLIGLIGIAKRKKA